MLTKLPATTDARFASDTPSLKRSVDLMDQKIEELEAKL